MLTLKKRIIALYLLMPIFFTVRCVDSSVNMDHGTKPRLYEYIVVSGTNGFQKGLCLSPGLTDGSVDPWRDQISHCYRLCSLLSLICLWNAEKEGRRAICGIFTWEILVGDREFGRLDGICGAMRISMNWSIRTAKINVFHSSFSYRSLRMLLSSARNQNQSRWFISRGFRPTDFISHSICFRLRFWAN
jgi:hypothetical protein